MEEFSSITRYEIEQSLSPEQLRISQIISFAMLMGPLFLAGLVFYFDSLKMPSETPVPVTEDINTFTYIVSAFTLVVYFVIYNFNNIFASPKALANRINTYKTASEYSEKLLIIIGIDRQFMIIRYALMEGAALFGVAVLFILEQNSAYKIPADFWLFLLPFIIFAGYVLLNFPTKEKTLERIENGILKRLKS